MKKLIIYGVGDHAELVYAHFKRNLSYEVVAFTVEENFLCKSTMLGIPVIPFEKIEQHISPHEADMHVAIGPIQLNSLRKKFCELAEDKGYTLASFLHLGNQISFLPDYGENCFFDSGTIFHPFTKVGKGVTTISARIGHHVQIGDYAFISAATIGGRCIIESNVFIGTGAIIKEGIRIGEGSIIGMGCIIKKHVEPYSVYSLRGTEQREGISSRDITLFKKNY